MTRRSLRLSPGRGNRKPPRARGGGFSHAPAQVPVEDAGEERTAASGFFGCLALLNKRVAPAHGLAVAIRHHPVELLTGPVKHQRHEIAVALPERQVEQTIHVHPLQRPLRVFAPRIAMPAIDAEHKTEPVLAMLAEAGPVDRAAENDVIAFQAGLFANFPPHAGNHVLARIELAAEPVVLAVVRIVAPAVTVNEQHLAPVGGQEICQRGQNRRVGHVQLAERLARPYISDWLSGTQTRSLPMVCLRVLLPVLFAFAILAVAITPLAVRADADTTDKARGFVKNHEASLRRLEIEAALAWWVANISGKPEDFKRKADAQNRIDEALANPKLFEELKDIRKASKQIDDPVVGRAIDVLYLTYLEKQVDPELLKKIVEKSNKVEEAFNVFRAKVDGQELTDNEVRKILKESNSSERRQAAWEASKKVGAVVEADLKELVTLRNEAATKLGFKNFHGLQLYLNEQDGDALIKLFDE